MGKNNNILKKGMILVAVSTMVVTIAPAILAYTLFIKLFSLIEKFINLF